MAAFLICAVAGFIGAYLPLHFLFHPPKAPWGEEPPPRSLKPKIWLLVTAVLFVVSLSILFIFEMEKRFYSPVLLQGFLGVGFGLLANFLISDHMKNHERAWGDRNPLYATGSLVAIVITALLWPYSQEIARSIRKVVTPLGSVEFQPLRTSTTISLSSFEKTWYKTNLTTLRGFHASLLRDIRDANVIPPLDSNDPYPGHKFIYNQASVNIGEEVSKFYQIFLDPIVECAENAEKSVRDPQVVLDNIRPVVWRMSRLFRITDEKLGSAPTEPNQISDVKENFANSVRDSITGMSAAAPGHCRTEMVPKEWPDDLASPPILVESPHFYVLLALLYASTQNYSAAIEILESQMHKFENSVNYIITLGHLNLVSEKGPDEFLPYYKKVLERISAVDDWLKRVTANEPEQMELDLCGSERNRLSDAVWQIRKRNLMTKVRIQNHIAYFGTVAIAGHPNSHEFSDWMEIVIAYAAELEKTTAPDKWEEWECLPDLLPEDFNAYKASVIDTVGVVKLVAATFEHPIEYSEINHAKTLFCDARRTLLVAGKIAYETIFKTIEYHIQQANILLGRDPREGC